MILIQTLCRQNVDRRRTAKKAVDVKACVCVVQALVVGVNVKTRNCGHPLPPCTTEPWPTAASQKVTAQVGRLVAVMGASSSSPEAEVWPPDWNEMQEDKRKTAREAILSLSAMPPLEFLAIANAPYVIPAAVWRFDEYHAAAAAAVQEDIKLNKIIYKCVPKKLEESEFWRLYFSQVLYILDSVKVHGKFPPPPPPPPPPVGKGGTTKGVAPTLPPPPPDDSSCILS